MEITYKLKSGKTLKRYYSAILPESYNAYRQFYNCGTVREHECLNEAEPLKAGQYLIFNDCHVNGKGEIIDPSMYLVPEKDVTGLVKAANRDIRNWTADSRKIFIFEEYDPAKDNSAYSLDVYVDQRLPDVKVIKLETDLSYYNFTTEDKSIAQYVEAHPELLSDQNRIADDDPMLGGEL